MTHPSSPLVWIVTEGMAGTENQCLGVAESLGIQAIVKRISLRQPWAALSPWLGFECAGTFTPELAAPWPDLLIASGRKSIAASRYIKRKSGGKTFTLQIQDPRIDPKNFDLVAVPAHDPTRGENVIVTEGTPNRITSEKLEAAKKEFAERFESLPTPRLAVLIGGSTKSCKITKGDIENLVSSLKPLAEKNSLMITASRRTGEENLSRLKEELRGGNIRFWNEEPPNPYLGMLGWADAVLVTNDSTSMISDAATTGKPVYILPLVKASRRQGLLIQNLEKYGAIRRFSGEIEHWDYTPLNDSARIAAAIRGKNGLFAK